MKENGIFPVDILNQDPLNGLVPVLKPLEPEPAQVASDESLDDSGISIFDFSAANFGLKTKFHKN